MPLVSIDVIDWQIAFEALVTPRVNHYPVMGCVYSGSLASGTRSISRDSSDRHFGLPVELRRL